MSDDPAEVLRKAIEFRGRALARIPQAPPPTVLEAKFVDEEEEEEEEEEKPAPKKRPRPRPRASESASDEEKDGPAEPAAERSVEETINRFIDASAELVTAAGKAIASESPLARKQVHQLIDEITHGAETVFDAILNPEKYGFTGKDNEGEKK